MGNYSLPGFMIFEINDHHSYLLLNKRVNIWIEKFLREVKNEKTIFFNDDAPDFFQ